MLVTKPNTVEEGQDTASYISDMAEELSALAERDGLGFLAYLLAMVANQARVQAVEREGRADKPGRKAGSGDR
jgi:hypothetical protein